MATKRKQSQTLSLKGSTKIVTEFFEYSVNSSVLQAERVENRRPEL